MFFTLHTVKVKKVDLKKGVALVSFANTDKQKNMRIMSVDLFGGLRLRDTNKLENYSIVIPKYELGKWAAFTVEYTLEAE